MTIQAAYHGYSTRQMYTKSDSQLENKKDDDEDKSREQAAAVTIQAGFRGYQTRQAISTKKEEKRHTDAATRIQASVRSRQTRRHLVESGRGDGGGKKVMANGGTVAPPADVNEAK